MSRIKNYIIIYARFLRGGLRTSVIHTLWAKLVFVEYSNNAFLAGEQFNLAQLSIIIQHAITLTDCRKGDETNIG